MRAAAVRLARSPPPSSRNAAGVSKHGVSTGTLPGRAPSPPEPPQRDSPSRRRRTASASPSPPGAADQAHSCSSTKPLCRVHHPRGRGASRAQRPHPGPGGWQLGALGGGASQACPPGLFVCCQRRWGPEAQRTFHSPGRGRGGGGALAATGPGWARSLLTLGFCFVLKPPWGRGSTLSMRNFLFARLRLQSFCPALELTSGSRQCGSPRAHPGAPSARGDGGGGTRAAASNSREPGGAGPTPALPVPGRTRERRAER